MGGGHNGWGTGPLQWGPVHVEGGNHSRKGSTCPRPGAPLGSATYVLRLAPCITQATVCVCMVTRHTPLHMWIELSGKHFVSELEAKIRGKVETSLTVQVACRDS